MIASKRGYTEIVALLVEQEGINFNAKDIYLSDSIFNLIILFFEIIFGNYINYLKQHLLKHLKTVLQKLLHYLLNKKELISMLEIFVCLIRYFI